MPNSSEATPRKEPYSPLSWYRVTLSMGHRGAGKGTTVKNVYVYTTDAMAAYNYAKNNVTGIKKRQRMNVREATPAEKEKIAQTQYAPQKNQTYTEEY